MNYLNTPIEPEGGKTIHLQLAGPFETWLLNDGYQAKFIKHIPPCPLFKSWKANFRSKWHWRYERSS